LEELNRAQGVENGDRAIQRALTLADPTAANVSDLKEDAPWHTCTETQSMEQREGELCAGSQRQGITLLSLLAAR